MTMLIANFFNLQGPDLIVIALILLVLAIPFGIAIPIRVYDQPAKKEAGSASRRISQRMKDLTRSFIMLPHLSSNQSLQPTSSRLVSSRFMINILREIASPESIRG